MKFINLDAGFVNGSGLNLDDAYDIHEQIRKLFEDKIDDYALIGNGKQVCLILLGDDTGVPLTSINGTFLHNGNMYNINIPNDNSPVNIKIKLDNYDKDISEKIAIKNLVANYSAKDIKIVNITDNDYQWIFEIHFMGIEYRKSNYIVIKKSVKVFKEEGYTLIEDLK